MAYTVRVSVIDNCQLRCNYCLPDGPQHLLGKQHYLSADHYRAFASALTSFSIHKIRFTGGEPLLRKDLPNIVRAFAETLSCPLALTTNGLRFVVLKDALIDAGLTAVTFHLDTLREQRYQRLMGRGSVAVVVDAMRAASERKLQVKLNVVVQKGLNDDEIVEFLKFSATTGIQVRFIEQMNTGSARLHVEHTFLSGTDILGRIQAFSAITQLPRKDASTPAERWLCDELKIEFGLIASDTRPFCADCNRLRLNADGRMRTCLYEPNGFDIGLSRDVAELDLTRAIRDVIAKKRSFHPGANAPRVDFAMAQIGG